MTSSLNRSHSAPHLGAVEPFLPVRCHESPARPKLPRHRSSAALPTKPPTSGPPSGSQTPRRERVEDPFNLGAFFASPLSPIVVPNGRSDHHWEWLHFEDECDEHRSEWGTGYVSPISEEEEWIMAGESTPILNAARDEQTSEAIRREDKIGILSISDIFISSSDSRAYPTTEHALSPYSEDDPVDSEALYQAYYALRQAHTIPITSKNAINVERCEGLFSPTEDEDDTRFREEEDGWGSTLSYGFGVVLDIFGI